MTRKNPLLVAALAYAAAGLYVVPLYWTDDAGVCSCPKGPDCESPGKHPLTQHGLHEATARAKLIEAWWGRMWPRANIGIATGPSHLVVVDVDDKDGRPGRETWRRLVEELGSELEQTTIVDTPSGGFHVYFRAGDHDVSSKNDGLGPGIDVKAEGGYVVAPPSRIAGRAYVFRNDHV